MSQQVLEQGTGPSALSPDSASQALPSHPPPRSSWANRDPMQTHGHTDTGRAGSQCRHTDAGRVGSRRTDTRTHGCGAGGVPVHRRTDGHGADRVLAHRWTRGGRGPGARTHGHRAGGVQAHRQAGGRGAGGVPEAGPAGLPYLSSCFSRVRRLRAISAQASTAPCRVCRSGLCAIDSRRGKTATMGRTRRLSARRLGSEPEGRRAPLQVSGQVTGAPGLSLKPPPGQTPGPPGAGGRGAEDATHSWGSTCSPGPKPAPRGEGPDCSPRLPCRTRLAVSLPGDRAGQG